MTAEPASAETMSALVVDPATHAGEIARFLRRVVRRPDTDPAMSTPSVAASPRTCVDPAVLWADGAVHILSSRPVCAVEVGEHVREGRPARAQDPWAV